MFAKKSPNGYNEVLPGIMLKTQVHGEKTLMAEFRLDKGSLLPTHTHPHEQTGMLISGRLRLFIGDDVFDAEAGDSWCIPGGVEHRAEAVDDAVAIEVFSPVREDYLPQH